jgi:hypothetical protein
MSAEAFSKQFPFRNEVIIIIKHHTNINKCGSVNAVRVIATAYKL